MMEQTRGVETAFEIASAFIYGGSRWRDRAAWCGECDSYVPMVSLPVAATLDKTTNAAIFRFCGGESHGKRSKI